MMLKSSVDRPRIAQKLAGVKDRLAQAVSDELFLKHPDWLDRYGERGRQLCTNDARFHFEFLAGAIEAGSPEAFADYALWTARMLGSRGIAAGCLQENLAQIGHHVSTVLTEAAYPEVSAFLARGMEASVETPMLPDAPEPDDGLRLTREVYLAAILGGRRPAALTIVDEALRAGRSHVDIYLEVFAEVLHHVGRLWEANKITVAQEHMATAITQYAIAGMYRRLIQSGPQRGQMIVTGVAGELHQIGANLVADAMESRGWNVRFLGSNVPDTAILDAIEECSADVLCISTTIVANLPAAANLIRLVRSRLDGRAPTIVSGGAAYKFATHFAEDAGTLSPPADLRAALELLCS